MATDLKLPDIRQHRNNLNISNTLLDKVPPHSEDQLPLFDQNDKFQEFIDLKEIDPIMSTSFEMMIKEAFRGDKHFILAKIKTRSLPQSGSADAQSNQSIEQIIHHHYFNLIGILKIIFKKKGENIVGRFHLQNPLSAKNPLTNNLITGEVEFFMIKNPYLSLPQENRYPVGQTLSLKDVKGEFYGTDFNYIYSEDMQREIKSNALEHYLPYFDLEQYQDPQQQDWSMFLGDRNSANDIQFHNDLQEIIQSAYIHSKKFYLHGVFGCIYFVTAVSTLLAGLRQFFDDDNAIGEEGEMPDMILDPYSMILPVAVFVYDCDIRRVYRRQEKRFYVVIKIIYWLFYYGVIAYAKITRSLSAIEFVNFLLIIWPIIAIAYSVILLKFKVLTIQMTGPNEAPEADVNRFERFERMIQERQALVMERQEQFDQQNFGGEQLVAIDIVQPMNEEGGPVQNRDQRNQQMDISAIDKSDIYSQR